MSEEEKAEEKKEPAPAPALGKEPPPDKLKEWGLAILMMTFLALVLLSFVMFIKGKL